MRKITKKKAAIELSMTTIIVVTLSLVLLILGFFLIRNIMCGAITFSSDLNRLSSNQLQSLFGTTSNNEISCLGTGGNPIYFEPGEANYLSCIINAKTETYYRVKISRIFSPGNEIDESALSTWLYIDNIGGTGGVSISPGDDEPRTEMIVNVPEDASLVPIRIELTAEKKEGNTWKTMTGNRPIDAIIRKRGTFNAALC